MSLDELNNSQMALLSILISIFVGSAMSIVVIASLADSIFLQQYTEQTNQTIVKQTINRIIERTTPSAIVADITNNKIKAGKAELTETVSKLQKALTPIYFRNTVEGVGIFISDTGNILAFKEFSTRKTYTVPVGEDTKEYTTNLVASGYTLLQPTTQFKPSVFLLPQESSVTLGTPLLLYGEINEVERLFFSTVSQLEKADDGTVTRFRVGSNNPHITIPSVVIINGQVSGFFGNKNTQWVQVLPKKFFEQDTKSALIQEKVSNKRKT